MIVIVSIAVFMSHRTCAPYRLGDTRSYTTFFMRVVPPSSGSGHPSICSSLCLLF